MIDPEKNDEINDFYCVQVTIGALLFMLGLAGVLTKITLWAFDGENMHLKWGLICLYHLIISYMPGVRLFLSPLMVPELNWQVYRYTGGFFFIFAGHTADKFFAMITIGLYVLFFYCIAKHKADSSKGKTNGK